MNWGWILDTKKTTSSCLVLFRFGCEEGRGKSVKKKQLISQPSLYFPLTKIQNSQAWKARIPTPNVTKHKMRPRGYYGGGLSGRVFYSREKKRGNGEVEWYWEAVGGWDPIFWKVDWVEGVILNRQCHPQTTTTLKGTLAKIKTPVIGANYPVLHAYQKNSSLAEVIYSWQFGVFDDSFEPSAIEMIISHQTQATSWVEEPGLIK